MQPHRVFKSSWQVTEDLDALVVRFPNHGISMALVAPLIGLLTLTMLFLGSGLYAIAAVMGLLMIGCFVVMIIALLASPDVMLRVTPTELHVRGYRPWRWHIVGDLDTVHIEIQSHTADILDDTVFPASADIHVGGTTVHTGTIARREELEAFSERIESLRAGARERIGQREAEVPDSLGAAADRARQPQ